MRSTIFFKVFELFSQIENTLKTAESLGIPNSEFSVLKILDTTLPYQSKQWFDMMGQQELDSNKLLGTGASLGIFKSQEYGLILISGSLASLFLYNVEGKALGELSTGIYGVFRGLGITQESLDLQLNVFKQDSYMLVARTDENLLTKLESLLLDFDKNSFQNSNFKKAI